MLKNFYHKANYHIKLGLLKRKKFDLENSFIICSEPRSGSTWLTEMLRSFGFIINWEPLHLDYGILPSSFDLGWVPFIPEDEKDDHFLELLRQTLLFRKSNHWTLSQSTASEIVKGNRVVTKFVRANIILPWMTKNLILNHKPIYLLRHPITSSISWLRHFPNRRHFYQPPTWRNSERFKQHGDFLYSLKAELHRQIAFWCLNNKYTICHPRAGKDWIPLHYEHLVSDPRSQLKKIFEAWQVDFPDGKWEKLRVNRASGSDFDNSFRGDPLKVDQEQISSLSMEDRVIIQGIFDYFGLNVYTTQSLFPS